LHIAAKLGKPEALTLLVQSKADPNAKGRDDKSAWDIAANQDCKRKLERLGAGDFTLLINTVANKDLGANEGRA
jgi:hypothetical protein